MGSGIKTLDLNTEVLKCREPPRVYEAVFAICPHTQPSQIDSFNDLSAALVGVYVALVGEHTDRLKQDFVTITTRWIFPQQL